MAFSNLIALFHHHHHRRDVERARRRSSSLETPVTGLPFGSMIETPNRVQVGYTCQQGRFGLTIQRSGPGSTKWAY
jgi:plasmid stabilization system protein ParE